MIEHVIGITLVSHELGFGQVISAENNVFRNTLSLFSDAAEGQ